MLGKIKIGDAAMRNLLSLSLALTMLLLCAACAETQSAESTTATPLSATQDTVYTIADYYNENGGLSALGLALPLDMNTSERMLEVKAGNILVVGAKRYRISAKSIVLPLYTQPSLDQVFAWWTEYCESWIENGEASEVSQ
jgi:hypothetical protein